MSSSLSVLGASSYGLNRGSYQASDDMNIYPHGRDVSRPDPKLIFILDYPKAIADMTNIGDNLGEKTFFDYIFIQATPPDYEMPPSNWVSPPGLGDRTWQEIQADHTPGLGEIKTVSIKFPSFNFKSALMDCPSSAINTFSTSKESIRNLFSPPEADPPLADIFSRRSFEMVEISENKETPSWKTAF